MTHLIHINIGSNSGCRHALIERAVAAVSSSLGGSLSRSEIIETEPWGFQSANTFLNIGIMVSLSLADDTDMSEFAFSLLSDLKTIERSIDPSPHRDPSGAYIDRAIDIDLIAIDDLVIDSPVLTLPHPHMHERDFVLLPLLTLAPEWRHPLLNKTATELADTYLGNSQKI